MCVEVERKMSEARAIVTRFQNAMRKCKDPINADFMVFEDAIHAAHRDLAALGDIWKTCLDCPECLKNASHLEESWKDLMAQGEPLSMTTEEAIRQEEYAKAERDRIFRHIYGVPEPESKTALEMMKMLAPKDEAGNVKMPTDEQMCEVFRMHAHFLREANAEFLRTGRLHRECDGRLRLPVQLPTPKELKREREDLLLKLGLVAEEKEFHEFWGGRIDGGTLNAQFIHEALRSVEYGTATSDPPDDEPDRLAYMDDGVLRYIAKGQPGFEEKLAQLRAQE